MIIPKIGDKTYFTFKLEQMQIADILLSPNINMWWSWKKEVCPHCKEIIEKRVLHNFTRIDIFIPCTKRLEECEIKDIICIGFSEPDESTLILTKEKTDEALKLSEKFKHLLEVK